MPSEEEFVRLPYASHVKCEPVRYEDDPYFVFSFTLTKAGQRPDPAHDEQVTFIVDQSSAESLVRETAQCLANVQHIIGNGSR